jgi:LuxR family maltose regulon positive regulatory protein
MAMPVLATKLFVPPPRTRATPRPDLIARLNAGLDADRILTLVSAPAGFGKTSLLSEWATALAPRRPAVEVAWVSLDDSDNDPARFLAYLTSALGADAADAAPSSTEAALTSLLNDVSRRTHRTALVLDDFHVIATSPVRDAVVFLLDHLPPTLHLVIASRSDPLLPIARLRARGELTELRAADLRFSLSEASDFLTRSMDLALTDADVAALETRTEGWIAGLQLAALSMRERDDVPEFIQGFTGSHRFVVDYLAEEVLERQSERVRGFLADTAILDRLSGPLCDAVTGQTDGAAMLAALERANLFVVPLDDRREWYRYHHLFADVLRARLGGGDDAHTKAVHTRVLHQRASEWCELHDLPDEAVAHALAAEDFDRAARVMEGTVPAVRRSRQDATLIRWLSLLPDATVRARPVLSLYRAWSLLVAGDIGAVEPWLHHTEDLLASSAHDSEPSDELRTLPVTIEVYRAALAQARGDLIGIRAHAQRARELAGPEDHLGRGAASGFLGLALWTSGDLEGGIRSFEEVAASLREAGNLTDALSTTVVVADMLIGRGRLRAAQDVYERALREAADVQMTGQPLGDLHAGIGELLIERDDRAAAAEHLALSDALGDSARSHENRYRWFVASARLRCAEGDPDAALDALATAEGLYRRGFFPDVRPLAALKARVWITQGRVDEAQAWADATALSVDDEPDYVHEFGHLTLARLVIARHRADQDAGGIVSTIALLDRLLAVAVASGRNGSAIEILALHALALEATGRRAAAVRTLEKALASAEPEGYVRLFADEGAPMAKLLRASAQGPHAAYVHRISGAFTNAARGVAAPQSLTDPLSERELHVLRLLSTPLSGPEIARELYISLNTLRTHTKHIFTKLEVQNRPAAVRRGEALGLI